MNKKLFAVAITLLLFGGADRFYASLIIAVEQSGANDPINVNQPRVWNFGVTAAGADYFTKNGLFFDSALFDAKIHKNTTAPLVFTIYSGLGGNVNGNTVLTRLSVRSSEFDQRYSGGLGETFEFKPKLFSMGYYSVTLTSVAPDNSTTDYFLKQGKLTLLNSHETPLDSLYWLQDQGTGNATSTFNGTGSLSGETSITLAPEVSTVWAMALMAGMSLWGSFLCLFQRKPAAVAV